MSLNYREKAIRFGQTGTLLGILTEPPAGVVPTDRAVILLNSGLLHRVGPSRLHVQVARQLAPQGMVVLRFDFSGIGDSEARRDALAFEQSAVLETQEAMDYLSQAKGVKQFTLWGLCSGADAAFLAAVADPRVTAVVQLDAWIYRTWKFNLRHYAPKFVNRTTWKNFLTGRNLFGPALRRLLSRKSAESPESADENIVVSHYAREFPPRDEVAAKLGTLLERGVQLLYIFSGGQPEHMNYAGQFRDCFSGLDLRDLVTVHYDGAADHIFSDLPKQRFVVATTTDWVLRRTPAAAPKREAAELASSASA